MTNPTEIYRFADVGLKPLGSLAETARELGRALGGLSFTEECSGKYEEYPAFTARNGDLTFALLGQPDPEFDIGESSEGNFYLQVESVGMTIGAKRHDISDEIVVAIKENSALVCWKLK